MAPALRHRCVFASPKGPVGTYIRAQSLYAPDFSSQRILVVQSVPGVRAVS